VTAEAVKILRVVEKCSKGKGDAEVSFDFEEHLLGGVSSFMLCLLFVMEFAWGSLDAGVLPEVKIGPILWHFSFSALRFCFLMHCLRSHVSFW
jgi:hypothetical protein